MPAPSAELDRFLKCMDGLVGGAGVTVSATTNGVHADRGHALGTSVDIKPPQAFPPTPCSATEGNAELRVA